MKAKIIPFPNSPPEVVVELPNKVEFKIAVNKLKAAFENPSILSESERDGLTQLALAILYTDHCKALAAIL
jgi:hypothetical protein